ncbi:class I SAM-dependent methyltransferase [Aquimarina sp. AU474]|uniref:class I SAM-dependent methyltransferase n=1 Tax=Aquimarina sp. AU474 TaxID=2108529 RepID=UPI000D68E6D4|nr:class I SAM-dependent methyltransferase [Aquimarina sp. AU474]
MSQDKLWTKLLKVFENNQDKIRNISNFESENNFVSLLIHESLSEYNQLVIENVYNIVKYYLFYQKVDVIDLIKFIKEKSNNNAFDIITLERESQDSFDNKFGTLTGVIKEQFMLHDSISMDRYQNSARYHPTPIKSMHLALDSLKKYNINYNNSIFIDVGSGMGRNLLIASEYPFKKIIGIEISKYLNEIAEKNISIYKTETQKCKNIDSYCGDALNFSLPDYNCLVLYFWEPFDENIFNPFFQKITQSIKSKDQKVFLVFLGKVFSEVRKSKIFKLKDYKETNDKISETDHFYISTFSN